MDANQRAKREIIAAFFDNAEARVAFLPELDRTGHRSEAMTLCLTYIDGFSQWLVGHGPRAAGTEIWSIVVDRTEGSSPGRGMSEAAHKCDRRDHSRPQMWRWACSRASAS
jgi:hypothetical protein